MCRPCNIFNIFAERVEWFLVKNEKIDSNFFIIFSDSLLGWMFHYAKKQRW